MTKEDALRHILWEYRRDKGSKASFRKSLRALAVLGIEEDGRQSVLRELGYIDMNGKPYPVYVE